MSWNLGEKQEWEFPHLRDAFQLPTINSSKHRITRLSNDKNEFWAVKFYPYSKPRVDPIYAVVGGRHIIICRPLGKDQKNAEIIKTIIDEDEETDNYACAWTKDLATGRPLICVAGANAKIKIIDVQSGTIQRLRPPKMVKFEYGTYTLLMQSSHVLQYYLMVTEIPYLQLYVTGSCF
ncbi:hypothetical protein ACMFMG_003329 [Clarireedia jacksonii]